jgi:hypothetical protein
MEHEVVGRVDEMATKLEAVDKKVRPPANYRHLTVFPLQATCAEILPLDLDDDVVDGVSLGTLSAQAPHR